MVESSSRVTDVFMKIFGFLGQMGNSDIIILILRLADGIIQTRVLFGGKIILRSHGKKVLANGLPVCVVDHPRGHAAV